MVQRCITYVNVVVEAVRVCAMANLTYSASTSHSQNQKESPK